MSRKKTSLVKILSKLASRTSTKPVFIYRSYPKDEVYDHWLLRIKKMESMQISDGDPDSPDYSFDLAYLLFPLLDSISYNLFGKDARKYLVELGYTPQEADITMRMFRNGHLHNGQSYRLMYDDGEVSWAVLSSSGSGSPRPYDVGYHDPENPAYDYPGDRGIEYLDVGDGSYNAGLDLDRLIQHVKYDLEHRKENDARTHIDKIVGQRVQGKRRRPSGKMFPDEAQG